jgi:DNA-binding beta-propeller fold protein YncE
LKKSALLFVALVVISVGLVCCGGGSHSTLPPSKLTTRVFASQNITSLTANPGLVIINGEYDTLARTPHIITGTAPGYMEISPERATLMVFDTATNNIDVVNTAKETLAGTIPLPGPTISMVAPSNNVGYVAVSSAPVIGFAPGALVALNLTSNTITASISVPNAQYVVSNSGGSQLLVFSNESNSVSVVSPLLLNTGAPITTTVPGFDRPVYAVFSSDGNTAYVLNCGPQCGGTQASVQPLNMTTLVPGTPVPVDAATVGLLSGSTLFVAGTPPTNNPCTGQVTAATTCGRLDMIDLGSMTVTGRIVITDGYHDRIDMSSNGQLFIGSYDCTNIGNVNALNPSGEIRGCLSIYNTNIPGNTSAIIPPDNGDVTGLQSFSTRYVEYVAEGGNLRVYDTQTDSFLLSESTPNGDITLNGTIAITGQIIDVKQIDFF